MGTSRLAKGLHNYYSRVTFLLVVPPKPYEAYTLNPKFNLT